MRALPSETLSSPPVPVSLCPLWQGAGGMCLRVCKPTKDLGCFSCVQLFEIPWTVADQTPLSMGFPRQGYWSGLPFPSPGDLPNSEIKPASPAWQVGSLPLSHLARMHIHKHIITTHAMGLSLWTYSPLSLFVRLVLSLSLTALKTISMMMCISVWP